MTRKVTFLVKRIVKEGFEKPMLPHYATEGASGLDLCAHLSSSVVIPPMERALIPTGITIALPPGFEAQIRPRSGLAWKHGVVVLNAPGTIDSDYRGEIQIILANLGKEPFTIRPGDRIAQMVIAETLQVLFEEAHDDLPVTLRGSGGFGHTGL